MGATNQSKNNFKLRTQNCVTALLFYKKLFVTYKLYLFHNLSPHTFSYPSNWFHGLYDYFFGLIFIFCLSGFFLF